MNSLKVCYARVSTTEQAHNQHALEQQLYRLNKTSPDIVYCDVQSGRSDERPEFQKLLQAIKEGKIRRLSVTNIDRIARNGKINRDILEALRDSRTELYVLDKNRLVDLLDPDDWYDANQEGLRAERESDKIRQRVNNGIKYFRAMGKANGRTPDGYIRNRETEKYELDTRPLPECPSIKICDFYRRAVELFLEYKNARLVNQILRHKYNRSKINLTQWIINPVLRGHTRYELAPNKRDCGHIVWNTHPDQVLITETEYQLVDKIIRENRRLWGINNPHASGIKPKTIYPLSSLVFCAQCGGSMKHKSMRNGRYIYLRCRRHAQEGDLGCAQKKLIPLEKINSQLSSLLTKKAEQITEMVTSSLKQDKQKSTEELKLETRLEKLQQLYSQENLLEIEILIKKTKQEIESIKIQSQTLFAISEQQLKLLRATFSNPLYFASLLPNEQKQIFHSLINKIVIGQEGIELVEFTF